MMYSNYYLDYPKICHPKTRTVSNRLNHSFRPKMNVLQNDVQITLEFSLAGVLKEDVKTSLEDRILSIEAQRKLNQDEKQFQYREFGPVLFKTKVQLPEDVIVDSIQAQFQHGILKISMKKSNKPNFQIEIK